MSNYTKALFNLLPAGFIMPQEADNSDMGGLIDVGADAMQAVETASNTVMDELFPDKVSAFTNDWHRVLGFPRCGITSSTQSQKVDANIAWLNIGELSDDQFFIDIAAVMGYTITISDVIGSTGVSLGEAALTAHQWRVTSTLVAPTIIFKMGAGVMGDPLVDTGSNDPLECLIEFFSPAHTQVLFEYI